MLTANDPANVKNRLIPKQEAGRRESRVQFLLALENDVALALKIGDLAPDFEIPAIAGERSMTIRSRDYLGRHNLVVAFHPLDWTPT